MAVVKNLMVRAGADFSAITQQANKASKGMKGMQQSVSRSCNLMTKAVSGIKKILGAVGVALSARALYNYGKEAAAAYDTQIQGEMKLATVMRNTMGASNAEIQSILDLTAAEQQLGLVSDEVQLAGAQQLSTYLHLSSSLKTLLPVMNDLAVQQYGLNVSEEQATSIAKLFGKAMEGQISALTRYGFTVSAAQQQIMKYGSEEERAATLADIVRQRVGGMNAALASTPSGRMQQLSNALGDVKEKFGQAVRTMGTVFLPILNAVGSALAGIATIANKVAQAIANVFGGSVAGKEWKWSGISAGISDTTDAVDDLTDAQNSSAGAAKKQKEALQTASFDTLNILKATDAAGGGGGGGAVSGGGMSNPFQETDAAAQEAGDSVGWLEKMLKKLKSAWESFRKKLDFTGLKAAWGDLKKAVSNFGSAVGEILGPVWKKYLEPLAVWTINKALPGMLELVAQGFNLAAEAIRWLKKGFEEARKAVSNFFKNLKVSDIVSALIMPFSTAYRKISEVMERIKGRVNLDSIVTTLKNVGQNILNAFTSPFQGGYDTISWFIDRIKSVVNLDSIVTTFRNIGQNILDSIQSPFQGVYDTISWFIDRIKSVVNLDSIVTAFSGIGQKILDSIPSPFQGAYDTISWFIDRIKGLMNFSWNLPMPKVPHISWEWNKLSITDDFSISIPKFSVKWYAKGGIFDQASLIGVGENGKEAVVPLERNTGWISKVATELATQMAGGAGMLNGEALIEGIHDAVYEAMVAVMGMQNSGDRHQTILNINGREFFRATWSDYKAVARERGVSLVNT